MRKMLLGIACVAAQIVAVPAFSNEAESIKGAGSTYVTGAYTSWAFSYSKEKNVNIKYQPTGSGDGIKQIIARTVDFAASDYALSAEELKKHDLVQFPTLVSGVVPVVNLPGIRSGKLRLTGPILAAIFSGEITTWNSKEIQSLNPDLTLPKLPIIRIVRADQSGTTFGFTEYLSKVDPQWEVRIGQGLTVNWPKGFETAKGNEGMAKAVKSREGSIGYVSANQVAASQLSFVLLQNRSKAFVAPTEEAMLIAVKSSVVTRGSEKLNYVDAAAPGAWPITDATYVLIERNPKNPKQVARVLQFFYWAFLRGDAMASDTGYVPLPSNVQARAVGMLGQVRDGQGNPLNFMTGLSGTGIMLTSNRFRAFTFRPNA